MEWMCLLKKIIYVPLTTEPIQLLGNMNYLNL